LVRTCTSTPLKAPPDLIGDDVPSEFCAAEAGHCRSQLNGAPIALEPRRPRQRFPARRHRRGSAWRGHLAAVQHCVQLLKRHPGWMSMAASRSASRIRHSLTRAHPFRRRPSHAPEQADAGVATDRKWRNLFAVQLNSRLRNLKNTCVAARANSKRAPINDHMPFNGLAGSILCDLALRLFFASTIGKTR
jgi:hypothetical protein